MDLFGCGITGPNAQAVLSRIRERSAPWGGQDDRTVGKRRLDAMVDLLLGRDRLPLDDSDNPFDAPALDGCSRDAAAGSCGCRVGQPVPCGIAVSLLVPLGTALGTSDEPASLAGHGVIEPDLLAAVLRNAPFVRTVWVDEDGVPVGTADRAVRLPAGDPAGVRQALLRLAGSSPPSLPTPRHPYDHPPGPPQPERPPPDDHPRDAGGPECADAAGDAGGPGCAGAAGDAARGSGGSGGGRGSGGSGGDGPAANLGGSLTAGGHVEGAGQYRVPRRLRRLLQVRAPLCEWPGCGHRSVRCDLDHDVAWPAGPTCGCNLGPCCRRHHRLKQLLMRKSRTAEGVVWTSPTGRRWTSPAQHEPALPHVRPLPDLVLPTEDDLAWDGGRWDDVDDGSDPGTDELRAEDPFDTVSDDVDPFLAMDLDGWGLALDDPTRWHDPDEDPRADR